MLIISILRPHRRKKRMNLEHINCGPAFFRKESAGSFVGWRFILRVLSEIVFPSPKDGGNVEKKTADLI